MLLVAVGLAGWLTLQLGIGGNAAAGDPPAAIDLHVINDRGELVGPIRTPTVRRTDALWKGLLTGEQYRIVRRAGTERSGSGTLLKNKADGIYACVACRLPLFASSTKYESGTGWPSFYEPISPTNVADHDDTSFGMLRTEIRCARCEGHLGHVFHDGPAPMGLRYCVNSLSLMFAPAQDLAMLADPAATRAAPVEGAGQATAVLAGGCFWCVEAVFEEVDGVIEAVSGYAGGTPETATYKQVSGGRTGHAEAVRITYDPSKLTYEQLLDVHFATHDPTTPDRQGNDVGPQYRSVIFYADAGELARAKAFLAKLRLEGRFSRPVVSRLEPLSRFHEAEIDHQDFVRLHPRHRYVVAVSLPKLRKLHKAFPELLKNRGTAEPRAPTTRSEE